MKTTTQKISDKLSEPLDTTYITCFVGVSCKRYIVKYVPTNTYINITGTNNHIYDGTFNTKEGAKRALTNFIASPFSYGELCRDWYNLDNKEKKNLLDEARKNYQIIEVECYVVPNWWRR